MDYVGQPKTNGKTKGIQVDSANISRGNRSPKPIEKKSPEEVEKRGPEPI